MSLLNKILGLLGVLSTVITFGVAIHDEKYRGLAIVCAIIAGLAGTAFIIQDLTGVNITKAEASQNRIFLAQATDNTMQSGSARRTAIGCYTLETSLAEDFVELLTRLHQRLVEISNTAREHAIEPRDKRLRNLDEKIEEWVGDRGFIESSHPVFDLLLKYSRRGPEWVVAKATFAKIGKHFETRVEARIKQAIRKIGDEDADDRLKRRQELIQGVASHSEELAREDVATLIKEVLKIRDTARNDLRKVLI
jgi:hypothetical protein